VQGERDELPRSLPLHRDDSNEERDDDGHCDGLQQPFGTRDGENDEARDDHEECEAPPATETTQASVTLTSFSHRPPILDRSPGKWPTRPFVGLGTAAPSRATTSRTWCDRRAAARIPYSWMSR
jgi:hypothetical protein